MIKPDSKRFKSARTCSNSLFSWLKRKKDEKDDKIYIN